MGARLPPALPGERHVHHPGHVERGDPGPDQRRRAEDGARGAALVERHVDDRVLGEEAGERWHADDRQITDEERHVGDGHDLAQAAEAAHVDLVVHLVLYRARPEEQAGLEEAVREEQPDRERVPRRPEPGRQHHVADLAHGRPRQHLLDVVLGAADDRAEQQRGRAHDGDQQPGVRREVEDRAGPDDQVDARGDHGGGVDQGRDRGGALHRVQQPGLQRQLGRLAAGAEQQQQPERGEHALARRACLAEDAGEGHRAEHSEHQHDRQ